jgi:hypothetical protein
MVFELLEAPNLLGHRPREPYGFDAEPNPEGIRGVEHEDHQLPVVLPDPCDLDKGDRFN